MDESHFVVNLPRHLMNVYKWSRESAVAALTHFNLRKKGEDKQDPPKCKDRHKAKMCPMDGCFIMVKHIQEHLQRVHKMDKTTIHYQSSLKRAPSFSAAMLPKDLETSPEKHLQLNFKRKLVVQSRTKKNLKKKKKSKIM